MRRRIEVAILGLLLVTLGFVYLHGHDAGVSGVQAMDTGGFVALNVQEPQLRLDMLEKIQKSTYSGGHRNIFIFGPAPVVENNGVETPEEKHEKALARFIGPVRPPEPPPPTFPGQYFGSALMKESGKRVAFIQNGEDIFVVPEGDTVLTRFRLMHVGNESADIVETASGKHIDVPMVPPVTNSSSGNGQTAVPPPDPEQ